MNNEKIGLIGGLTWVSTIEYYRLLNQLVNEKLGGSEAAEVIIYSVNFGEIKKFTEANDWANISKIICAAAKELEKAGAACVLLGANTMHKIAPEVQSAVSIPLIHIADVTATAIRNKELSKIALLGTKYTMQLDFYKNALAEKGIETLIPDEDNIQYINTAIYTELGKTFFFPKQRKDSLKLLDSLAKQGAEGVILGCTEIPLLLNQSDTSLAVFDTTLIHATAAVEFSLA
ncbi:MAG: amino acid racemase [Chitinophagaceae bacterium]|nr:amino acid racemase [Chitinophagaceae bacterium]